jgi:uncharacterized protein YegJ (DUF2314 family)
MQSPSFRSSDAAFRDESRPRINAETIMHARTKGRLAGFAFLLATGLMANAGPASEAGDPVIDYALHESTMTAAQNAAGASLQQFLNAALDRDGTSRPDTGIKVAFQTDEGRTEVIWVAPFVRHENGFAGLLANEPMYMPNAAGELVTFSPDAIRDWYLLGEDGRMYGSFTTRVMLTRMSPARADAIRNYLSEAPLPDSW